MLEGLVNGQQWPVGPPPDQTSAAARSTNSRTKSEEQGCGRQISHTAPVSPLSSGICPHEHCSIVHCLCTRTVRHFVCTTHSAACIAPRPWSKRMQMADDEKTASSTAGPARQGAPARIHLKSAENWEFCLDDELRGQERVGAGPGAAHRRRRRRRRADLRSRRHQGSRVAAAQREAGERQRRAQEGRAKHDGRAPPCASEEALEVEHRVHHDDAAVRLVALRVVLAPLLAHEAVGAVRGSPPRLAVLHAAALLPALGHLAGAPGRVRLEAHAGGTLLRTDVAHLLHEALLPAAHRVARRVPVGGRAEDKGVLRLLRRLGDAALGRLRVPLPHLVLAAALEPPGPVVDGEAHRARDLPGAVVVERPAAALLVDEVVAVGVGLAARRAGDHAAPGAVLPLGLGVVEVAAAVRVPVGEARAAERPAAAVLAGGGVDLRAARLAPHVDRRELAALLEARVSHQGRGVLRLLLLHLRESRLHVCGVLGRGRLAALRVAVGLAAGRRAAALVLAAVAAQPGAVALLHVDKAGLVPAGGGGLLRVVRDGPGLRGGGGLPPAGGLLPGRGLRGRYRDHFFRALEVRLGHDGSVDRLDGEVVELHRVGALIGVVDLARALLVLALAIEPEHALVAPVAHDGSHALLQCRGHRGIALIVRDGRSQGAVLTRLRQHDLHRLEVALLVGGEGHGHAVGQVSVDAPAVGGVLLRGPLARPVPAGVAGVAASSVPNALAVVVVR
mmetsp:Transcript_25175/g.74872  ORF Transcript_25175/g.74872 Transcript_25175/m.74872 type:complete len:731 (+) Transcript_25175:231-2423(+)